MIINLWSTPRTGSVWYSFHLSKQHPGSLLITEMFNRFHMDMYHVKMPDGSISNHHEYINGSFYKEYYLDSNKFLRKRMISRKRVRSVDEEEQYCFDLVKNVNQDQAIILHNHVDPMNEEIRNYLISNAGKNIWISRNDKKSQLASYAVAIGTKKFAAFKKQSVSESIAPDCDTESLKNLIRRIQIWDNLDKSVNSEFVNFESIDFYEAPGFPFDQNADPWNRLSSNVKQVIEDLVVEYENNQS